MTSNDEANEPETADAGAIDTAVMLRVTRGEPTPEELAALLAVIATRAGSGDEAAPRPKSSAWTDRSRYVRPGLRPSSDGWRASAFPR